MTPASDHENGKKAKPVKLFVLAEITDIVLVVFVFRWIFKILPMYSNMYEGMGDALPAITRFVFHNVMMGCAPFLGLILLYLLSHLALIKSLKAAALTLWSYAVLLLLLLSLFWFAARRPLWDVEKMLGHPAAESH